MSNKAKFTKGWPNLGLALISMPSARDPSDEIAGARREKRFVQAAVTFTVATETLRLVTYAMFWLMVGCAILFHNTLVLPKGAEACEAGDASCLFPVNMANTPLVRMFGYNNVCINWDYTPSRELTAMIYPFVEYPLIAYAVLDYIQIYRDYLDKELPSWFFKLATGALPIKILLLSWFRMIFVFDSFQNTAFHTLPFQGLQVSLVLVAVQNSLYWTTHKSPLYVKQLGQAWTHRLIWAYVACLLAVTAFKITVVTSIFANKPILDIHDDFSASLCAFADRAWMFLAAVIPFFLAAYERRIEVPLTISMRARANGGESSATGLL